MPIEITSSSAVISNGEAMNSVILDQGHTMRITDGGTATNVTLNPGGMVHVSSGGILSSASIYGGESLNATLKVSKGGVAIDTTVASQGIMYVYFSGTAKGATVNSMASMYIYTSGTASDVTILPGGGIHISAYTELSNVVVSAGGSANCMKLLKDQTFNEALHISSATLLTNGYIYRDQSVTDVTIGGVSRGSLSAFTGAVVNSAKLLNNGRLDVRSGATVNLTAISGGGKMYVSSCGTANDTTIYDGGVMFILNGGTAKGATVFSGGTVNVSSGATAVDALLCDGGVMNVSNGGRAVNAVVNDGVDLTIANGAAADGNTVLSGGVMRVLNGGAANGTTVSDGGTVNVSDGGVHRGTLQIETGATFSAYAGAVVDFTVAGRTQEDGYLVNDLSRISGTPTFTITMAADQATGVYKIAQGAADFTASVTLNDVSANYGVLTVNGAGIERDGYRYTLAQAGGNLTFTVLDFAPPTPPVATPSVTAPTNGDVTVAASFADDSVLNEYSLNGGVWTEYDSALVFTSNGTVSFRSTDAAGNVSEITECVVANIDKVAPTVPTAIAGVVSGHEVSVTWNAAADEGGSGIKGYLFRCAEEADPDGDGVFVAVNSIILSETDFATYRYQVRTIDNAGNLSDWSDLQSFTVVPTSPQELAGSSAKVSWQPIAATSCRVEYSTDDFANVLALTVETSAVNAYGMPTGTYRWQVRDTAYEEWSVGEVFEAAAGPAAPQLWQADADDGFDLFFARSGGTWEDKFFAEHQGASGGWQGTGEQVKLLGKNKITDIFAGSDDANVLCLTDDGNGDALFVDDVFSDSPVAVRQARLSQIKEVRAGAGNDVVDLTSQRFAFAGGVTVYGGAGDDTVWANSGNNTLFGDAGDDRLVGAAGDDVIVGGAGDDSMHGGGGNDIFCFGGNWGNDTVEQLATGTITLWFENDNGSWDEAARTYTCDGNSVTVLGTGAVTLRYGADASLPAGVFSDAASEKIFEDRTKGLLA